MSRDEAPLPLLKSLVALLVSIASITDPDSFISIASNVLLMLAAPCTYHSNEFKRASNLHSTVSAVVLSSEEIEERLADCALIDKIIRYPHCRLERCLKEILIDVGDRGLQ
jgi:hypothetical protein